jgi:outer membrane lipase/esterase
MAGQTGALAFSVICAAQAPAATFNQFVAFGDSTVDSGWFRGALNGQCDGAPSPCATGGANINQRIASAVANGGTSAPVGVGLMSSEILAQHFGLNALPANQPGGTNYAISGAKNADSGGSGNLLPNTTLPSTVEQIGNYLTEVGAANPHALYLVGSGGNDITYAQDPLNGLNTLAARQGYLANQAAALATAIASLQSAGAETILVRGLRGSGPLATFYTDALRSDLLAAGVDFIFSDVRTLIEGVQANPTLYGFTSVLPGELGPGTTSACVWDGPGVGWGRWCADSTVPSTEHAYLRSADAELTSLFSDDQHLSAAGQLILANYEIGLVETPVPAAFPLFATGLGIMGFLSWRRKGRAAAAAA